MLTTQTPNKSPGTCANAGYTCEFSPSLLDRNRACASSTNADIASGLGRWPVDMKGNPVASPLCIALPQRIEDGRSLSAMVRQVRNTTVGRRKEQAVLHFEITP